MLGFSKRTPARTYLDYAAATPLSAAVVSAMAPYWSEQFANPSAIHVEGVTARAALDDARVKLARVLGVRSEGVVFTGSGTESNNLAIGGILEASHAGGTAFTEMEVISTAIEHPSILRVLKFYEERGVTVHFLPVDAEGRVKVSELKVLLSKRTALVTIGYVNSEIGTVQPLSAVARAVRAFEREQNVQILVHTDAAQAPLWLPCQIAALGVDVMTLDAGKCYGPKGVGVLAMRHGVQIAPVFYGGGQEFGLRPGTENTPLIVGASVAITYAQESWKLNAEMVAGLRDHCIAACLNLPGVVLNGPEKERVANNVNISMSDVDAEFTVISLDIAGFAIATKSACSGRESGGSNVVRTISSDTERANSTLRITLGLETTLAEVDAFVAALSIHLDKAGAAL